MPPQLGEDSLVTLFADIHYYFTPPSSRPQHERFSRGSYVYLFNNPLQRRSRLEVANHAGTPDQDAFNGYLDTVSIEHAQKQPHLVTITVDGNPSKPMAPQAIDPSLWTLPAFDLKHEQRYSFKLHTLDIYFWTAADASKFVDNCRRVLPEHQLRLDGHAQRQSSISQTSHSEHQDALHPVVQQLEQAAIADPYRPRTNTTSTAHSAVHTSESGSRKNTPSTSGTPASLPNPAPYNPAAPAAPEPISHREKTPPPPEAAGGTGLAAAAVLDQPAQVAQYQYNQQQAIPANPNQSYFPGGPPSSTAASFPPPPPGSPPANLSSAPHTPTAFLGPPGSVPQPNRQSSLASVQYATIHSSQHNTPLQSPHYPQGTPLHSPTYQQHYTPLASPGLPQQQPYQVGFPPPPPAGAPPGSAGLLPPQQPPPPPGGFSNYTYGAAPTTAYHAGGADAGVHNQFYRPTEAELQPQGHVGSHAGLTAALAQQQQQQQQQQGSNGSGGVEGTAGQAGGGAGNATGVVKPGRFDERIGKVEKGVNRWLRKLDQKI